MYFVKIETEKNSFLEFKGLKFSILEVIYTV